MFRSRRLVILLVGWLALAAGCTDDMADQAKYEPFESSDFFPDGISARPQVSGTIAQGQLRLDRAFYEGKINDKPVESFPLPVTDELLARGRERFDIHCSPCHGRVGTGQGMVVKRGFPAPPSYHIPRLREAPVGHFYDVITNGFGRMFDYAAEVSPEDRWAIVAYIRALQLSQNVPRSRLSPEELRQLKPGKT